VGREESRSTHFALHCIFHFRRFMAVGKLPAKEMTADQDADWIVIGARFYKRSQVQQSLQTCTEQKVFEDDLHK